METKSALIRECHKIDKAICLYYSYDFIVNFTNIIKMLKCNVKMI